MNIDINIESIFYNETELNNYVFTILNEQNLIYSSENNPGSFIRLEFTKCKMDLKFAASKKSLHFYSVPNNNLREKCLKTDYVQNIISFFLKYTTDAIKKNNTKLSIGDIFDKGRFDAYSSSGNLANPALQRTQIKFILGLRRLKNIIIMPRYESVDKLFLNGIYIKKFDTLILYISGTKVKKINYQNIENSFNKHFLTKVITTIADAGRPMHLFLEPWDKYIHAEILELI